MAAENDLDLLRRFTDAVERSKGGELPPYTPDQIGKFIGLIDQQEEEIGRRIEALTTCLDNADTLLHAYGSEIVIEYRPSDGPGVYYLGPEAKELGNYHNTSVSKERMTRINEVMRSPCYEVIIKRWYEGWNRSQDEDNCRGAYIMNDNGSVEEIADDQVQLNKQEIIEPTELPIGLIGSDLKRKGKAMLRTFFNIRSKVRNCLHCPLKINLQNVDAKIAAARASAEIDKLQEVIGKFERTKQKLLMR